MSDEKRSVGDTVADGIGFAIEGLFYGIGRVSPAIADAANGLAKTRVGQHVVHHAEVGFSKGWNATLESRERRARRRVRAKWIRNMKDAAHSVKEAVGEVVDVVHEDIDRMRGKTQPRMG